VIAAQETRRPEPVGHQEFENAAKMRFCIEGLSKAGAFKENAFDDIGLAHRRVNRFNRYEDFPGMPTCYIQFEFERPEICAFSSQIVNGEIQYTLRGDSGASCSKFLTGKGYITEDKPINVKYELENPDHLSLREEQSMLIGEFIDLLKDSEAINKGYTLDVSDFTKISKTFGRYNQYTATFTHNNKNCHLIQNKYSDYMAKFELTVDSATDCSQVIKALDKQHGVFGHNGGNWQKAAADALGLAVSELNDNKLIKSGIKFTAKDLVNVKETMLNTVDMVDITVFKNGNQCQFKAKFTPDGETSWTNQSTEAACNALVNGGKFRL